jgi:hypothetical protein
MNIRRLKRLLLAAVMQCVQTNASDPSISCGDPQQPGINYYFNIKDAGHNSNYRRLDAPGYGARPCPGEQSRKWESFILVMPGLTRHPGFLSPRFTLFCFIMPRGVAFHYSLFTAFPGLDNLMPDEVYWSAIYFIC